MEFGPHHVIIIILRQKHSRTRRISEVDERRLTSLRPMASLCEEQRDESLRFHLGGLMTRSGYLNSVSESCFSSKLNGRKEGKREGRRNARVKERKGVDRGVGQERRRCALKTQSTTIYSTVIRPPPYAKVYVNDREKSDSLPSSRLYAISSLSFSGYSFWAQTIPRSNTESVDIVRRWTVRE
ncbi:hypothetical protein ALC60_09431 [Trachymyrmex zeteki]|uniref:Uncharacterized protein n=1 Tax=Mycetomoellerius zeteki TaxID=64791 RepID=A0A151WUA4_9HYME|nr:hypothetical protein ALC60_09431 [Trachymyrmex zeteki]